MATETPRETETPTGTDTDGTAAVSSAQATSAASDAGATTAADTTSTTTTGTTPSGNGSATTVEKAGGSGVATAGKTGGTSTATAEKTGESDTATAAHAATDLTPGTRRASGGLGAGAGAIVAAALGLLSLTGTSLGDMLRDRQQILGQLDPSALMGGNQIDALYGAPWKVVETVNGVFAVLAVIVGIIALGMGKPALTGSWARPVALGGLVLGVLGILVAGGMYLDLFGAQPQMPAMPRVPGLGG